MLLTKPVIGCYAVLCNPIPAGAYQLEDDVTSFQVSSIFTGIQGTVFIQRNRDHYDDDECFDGKYFMFYDDSIYGTSQTLGVPNA